MSKRLLIVAHAPSENTISMRKSVLLGAEFSKESGLEVILRSPLEADHNDVLNCDAIILGTTENLGYMSGALKDFFDRIYYPCLEEKQGLPYCLYIRAGQDGTGALRGVRTITTGLSWRSIQSPLICKGPWRPEFIVQCKDLGKTMAAGVALGVF